MAKELNDILVNLSHDLPGFVASAVVMVDDGLSLVEYAKDSSFEVGEASAYLASIVKSNNKAIKLLSGEQVTDDLLITTDKNYFLIRHSTGKQFFLFIMTTKNEWLGKARILIKKYEELVNQKMA